MFILYKNKTKKIENIFSFVLSFAQNIALQRVVPENHCLKKQKLLTQIKFTCINSSLKYDIKITCFTIYENGLI